MCTSVLLPHVYMHYMRCSTCWDYRVQRHAWFIQYGDQTEGQPAQWASTLPSEPYPHSPKCWEYLLCVSFNTKLLYCLPKELCWLLRQQQVKCTSVIATLCFRVIKSKILLPAYRSWRRDSHCLQLYIQWWVTQTTWIVLTLWPHGRTVLVKVSGSQGKTRHQCEKRTCNEGREVTELGMGEDRESERGE